MKKMKFWNWTTRKEEPSERVLLISGVIAEESWLDDQVSPQQFKEELENGEGDITVWINSPGGDCIAAAQIYNMLLSYKGTVTVQIDGIAASAASVIAMAGTKIMMSPVSMLMIHNPMTMVAGDKTEMEKAIAMLSEIKESIINAYEIKTKMTRESIAKLMDAETWMDATKAVELGFADDILQREPLVMASNMLYAKHTVDGQLWNKMREKYKAKEEGRSVRDLMSRLLLEEKCI